MAPNSTSCCKSGATRLPPNGFFKRVLRSSPVPRKLVTDQLRSYPAAKAEIILSSGAHVQSVMNQRAVTDCRGLHVR
jgi:transposase-like protein